MTKHEDNDHRQLPVWLGVAVLAVLVLAHTQVTLRHLAWRLAGIRQGQISAVERLDARHVRIEDAFAEWPQDALRGQRLGVGEHSFEVVENKPTVIVIRAPAPPPAEEAAPSSAPPVRLAVADGEPIELAAGQEYRSYPAASLLVKLARQVPGFGFTLADVALGITAVAMLGWAWRRREGDWRELLPPVCIIVYLAICAWSVLPWLRPFDAWAEHLTAAERAGGLRAGVKELVQRVEVLVVAFLVFRYAFRDPTWRRRAVWTVLGTGAVVVLLALWEYRAALVGASLRGAADVAAVDGTFGFRFNPDRAHFAGSTASRNVLAVYLLFLLPLAVSMLRASPHWPRRIALGALALLGTAAVLNGWLLLAVVLALAVVGLLWPSRRALPVLLAAPVLALTLICLSVPSHGRVLLDSLALHRHADPYGSLPMPAKGQDEQSSPIGWQPWQQKYVEMQAGLNALGYSPWLGHGLGSYQERINQFYTQSRAPHLWVEKTPANFMEKDAHGQWLVQAVETGVLGVLALLWVLLWAVRMAVQAPERGAIADRAALAGIAAVMAALIVAAAFAPFLVRGLQLIWAALLAYVAAAGPPQQR